MSSEEGQGVSGTRKACSDGSGDRHRGSEADLNKHGKRISEQGTLDSGIGAVQTRSSARNMEQDTQIKRKPDTDKDSEMYV
jgi:hypothetical protein